MYTEYQPSHLPVPYIDSYQEFKGNPDYDMRIHTLPDGYADFIFTLGEVANAVEGRSLIMQPHRSYFIGPIAKCSEFVTYTESIHVFGVRFLLCGSSCFTDLPLYESVNSRVSTNEMEVVSDDTSTERLGEQKHITDRIRVVGEYSLVYLARHYQPADPHVAVAVNMINHSKGKCSVRSLIDDVCLCQRHFERKFKHYTGFTPKEYGRIVKSKNAVELLRITTPANLLTTAVDTGYYDLAHFSKEIKPVSGNTPVSFLSLTVPEEAILTYIESQRQIRQKSLFCNRMGRYAVTFAGLIKTNQLMTTKTMEEKATELSQRCEIVTLTSVNKEDYLHPVPMSKILTEGISTIWMSTGADSLKIVGFLSNPKVGLCPQDKGDSVALTRKVEVVTDEKTRQEFWQN